MICKWGSQNRKKWFFLTELVWFEYPLGCRKAEEAKVYEYEYGGQMGYTVYSTAGWPPVCTCQIDPSPDPNCTVHAETSNF